MINRAKFLNLFLAVTIALVTVSLVGVPTVAYADGGSETSSPVVPTWALGDEWVYDTKYDDTAGYTEDDTQTVVVGSIDSAGTVVGGYSPGNTFTLPEDCYRLDVTFVNDGGGDVQRNTQLGWVTIVPAYAPLTWDAQDTLDEVYREAYVVTPTYEMATLFVYEYYDITTGLPTVNHGWPYDVGKEWGVYASVDAWIEPLHVLLTTITTYSIVEVESETSVTVPAGTFTVKHLVTYESDAMWTKGAMTSETWQNESPVKYRVKYIDRATYIGEAVDVLESYWLIPGDANGDGVVDVFDLVKVKRIILGADPPTPGADANRDGSIDVFDLVKIKRIILGLD